MEDPGGHRPRRSRDHRVPRGLLLEPVGGVAPGSWDAERRGCRGWVRRVARRRLADRTAEGALEALRRSAVALLVLQPAAARTRGVARRLIADRLVRVPRLRAAANTRGSCAAALTRSEEHTSELQSRS